VGRPDKIAPPQTRSFQMSAIARTPMLRFVVHSVAQRFCSPKHQLHVFYEENKHELSALQPRKLRIVTLPVEAMLIMPDTKVLRCTIESCPLPSRRFAFCDYISWFLSLSATFSPLQCGMETRLQSACTLQAYNNNRN
jgi:hypothetical protein